MAEMLKNSDPFQPKVFNLKIMGNNEEVFLESILNHLRDVILVIKKDMSIAWASPSIFSEWGYESGKLIGTDINMILSPYAARTFMKAFDEAVSVNVPPPSIEMPLELSVTAREGSTLWVEARCSLISDFNGGGSAIVCCCRDTSLRKLIDDTMQENISLLQILIDSIPDAIFIIDKNGYIEGVNRSFEDAIGQPGATLTGKTLKDMGNSSPNELISWLNTILANLEGSAKVSLDQVMYADGEIRDIVFNMIPYLSSSGESLGTIGIIYDVTERKRLETSLRKETNELKIAREELSKKNAELEAAYSELKETQAQILQQEKMASIGQLAAGVAHEINNPMGFISSNLSSLSKYVDKLSDFMTTQAKLADTCPDGEMKCELEEKRKKLKIDFIQGDIKDLIVESIEGAERVKKIVQDLKTFSRNDQLEYKESDINECMESTINIVWNELKYKATVIKEYGDIPFVKCFPQQINQVFMNILVNAVHAIETAGEIRVKTWDENGWVYAMISDNGHGIPPENLKKIFEPFFTTKEVGKGTGLGLSITYDIVRKHGGDISVKSEQGKGTTFTVRLPIAGVNLDE
ncbi:MAG TPA: ATP-binding protein [Desulfomonilia bacterium]